MGYFRSSLNFHAVCCTHPFLPNSTHIRTYPRTHARTHAHSLTYTTSAPSHSVSSYCVQVVWCFFFFFLEIHLPCCSSSPTKPLAILLLFCENILHSAKENRLSCRSRKAPPISQGKYSYLGVRFCQRQSASFVDQGNTSHSLCGFSSERFSRTFRVRKSYLAFLRLHK